MGEKGVQSTGFACHEWWCLCEQSAYSEEEEEDECVGKLICLCDALVAGF